jgi:hypothetical protein
MLRGCSSNGPDAPNLPQVHLLHEELFDDLRAYGFNLQPGVIGDNVTTRGIDLHMSKARLRSGADASAASRC